MDQRSVIRTGSGRAVPCAASVLAAALALLGSAPLAVRASDAGSAQAGGVDAAALAPQTRRLLNDAGQFYMIWWLPPVELRATMQDKLNLSPADRERMIGALEPYLVFAMSRGQEDEHGLVDVHDRADLLRHSHLTVNGQALTAAPADQDDPGARAALEAIKPALAAMLGSNGPGVEFALFRPASGKETPDPTLPGSIEYALYRKHFRWQLPLWTAAAPLPVRAPPAAVPAAPAVVASPVPPAPAASSAVAPIPVHAPAAVPVPVQRRKIDPTTGEEFPERYDYNPYTGQKLVSQ